MPNPQMGRKHLPVLKKFIEDFPKDVAMFTELRNVEFYQVGYNKELLEFLKKEQRGTIITDAAGKREVVHMHLSTPQAFIRFMGNGLKRSDYERIDQWVERIILWKEQGLEQLYFFIHQQEELDAPTLLSYLIKELNEKGHAGIRPPVWL